MAMPDSQRADHREVTSWPGVEAGPGSRGEFGFTLGRRQLGHLHGDRTFHFGFPKEVWHELYEQGRIDYHPVFPDKPGLRARAIESDADVDDVIALIRLNYERAVERHGVLGMHVPATHRAEALPFAPALHIRAFLLERAQGTCSSTAPRRSRTAAASRGIPEPWARGRVRGGRPTRRCSSTRRRRRRGRASDARHVLDGTPSTTTSR